MGKIDQSVIFGTPSHRLELSTVGKVRFEDSETWGDAIQKSFYGCYLGAVVCAAGAVGQLGDDSPEQQIFERSIRWRPRDLAAQVIKCSERNFIWQRWNDQPVCSFEGRFRKQRQTWWAIDNDEVKMRKQRPIHFCDSR